MSRVPSVLFAAAAILGIFSSNVCAQVGTSLTSSTPFPVSIVSPGGALSTDVNPAALGDLRSWAIRLERVRGAEGSLRPDDRSGGYLAYPTRWGIALAAGLESVDSNTAGIPSHRTLTWAGSLSSGPSWTFGGAWRIRFPDRDLPSAHTADLALAFRPSSTLGFAAIGRNLAIEPANLGTTELQRMGLLAAQLRPLGTDQVWVELSAGVRDQEDLLVRGAAGLLIPRVGALSVAAELDEARASQQWTLSAGLRVNWGNMSVAAAGVSTDAFDQFGWGAAVELQGKPRPGLPRGRYVAAIPIESAGARGILNVVLALDRALHDPRVRGVLLKPRASGAGLAAAQEVRLMVDTLRAAGKPVYCYLEAPSGAEYYLCAGADRITLDPAGNVRLMGLTARTMLFGDLVKKVGLRADFVRIGEYKSAPEQYTNRASTEPARRQREIMLDDTYRRMIADLARDRETTDEQMRSIVDRGPFVSREAEQDHLVEASLDGSEVNGDLKEVFGRRVRARTLTHMELPHRYGPTGQIGVVVIDGNIANGKNQDIPIIGIHTSGGQSIVEELDRMAANPRIRAVVLRVDSPGGAVLASDQIWRAVRRVRKRKPVIASMGSVAASGGYFVASAANEIWASPATVTGSIGIFYGKVDVQPLAEMLGVGLEEIKRGAHAGADSLYRPFTDEERAELVKKIRFWYGQFLERVAEGREMTVEEVDKLARGRIYSGDRAKEVGLVDHLGGFSSALARARQLAHLGPEASLVVRPKRPSSLLDYVLGASVRAQAGPVPETGNGSWPVLERLGWLGMLDGTEPLAIWDGQFVIE